MKLYNLNQKFNTVLEGQNLWQEWNKFLKDLNINVNSIYEYINYFNPDYLLLNYDNLDKYEPITISQYINETEKIYYLDLLSYKQGYMITMDQAFLGTYAEMEDIDTGTHKFDASIEPGFVCFQKNQITNDVDYPVDYRYSKDNLSSFLIFPYSISSLFNMYLGQGSTVDTRNMNFLYHSNQSEFSNQTFFNFALYALRYTDITSKAINRHIWSLSSLAVSDQVTEHIVGITKDSTNNICHDWWTGASDITSYVINNSTYEEILIDNTFSIENKVIDQKNIAQYNKTFNNINNVQLPTNFKVILL